MKNVAQMCLSEAWGGLEMSTAKWARHFANHGYRSFVITRSRSPLIQDLSGSNIQLCVVKGKDYFAPTATARIRRFIDEQKIEAVYLHSLRDLWILRPALAGRPHVRVFGFARMFLRGVEKKDWLHQFMYRRLEKLVALSHLQKLQLKNCLPLPDEKYVVVPNGVDIRKFSPGPASQAVRAELGAQPGQILVGLIGRLDPQKGQLEFVQAIAKLNNEFPQARYALVGGATRGEPSVQARIEELIQKHNLNSVLRLTDFRKDIPEVLRALDVFVMPSYEENFANVLLEAMACGRAAIGTNSGGTPEIIDEGETGVLVEPRNGDSLADGIARLLRAPQQIEVLGRQARIKAERVYDLEKVFTQVSSLI